MPYRVSKKCSELLDMTQTCPTKMFKIARNDPKLSQKNCSNCSKCFKMTQNVSKCLKTSQLSLLGSAVAGVYYCMGLRSMSIAPRSCLLLRSDPSIVNFNSEGSLVIRLAAIVSINGLSGKIIIALIGKNRLCPQFLLFHSCLLVIPQSDMNFWDFFVFFFEIRKVTNLNLTKILLFPLAA